MLETRSAGSRERSVARPRLTYQPGLDGLRGIAVGGVVAFHLGYLQGGFLGVDLFFTLSGYLITRLLLLEREATGHIDLWSFWSRRAWRLLPAVLLVLAAGAVYATTVARPDELSGIRDSGLAALVYVTNWQFISAGDGYWALFTTPSPFAHLWSLAIEEQFYVLWPLLVIPVLGRTATMVRTRRLLATTVTLVTISSLVFVLDNPTHAYLSTLSRSSSILVGAAVALVIHRGDAWLGRVVTGPSGTSLAFLAVAFLAWSWTSVDGSEELGFYNGGFFTHAVAVSYLVATITLLPAGRFAQFLSFAPFRELGVVSYGLYLWHWPIIVVFNRERTGLDGTELLLTRLGLIAAVTLLSFHLVERPARTDWSRRFNAAIIFPLAGVFVAIALLFSTVEPATRVAIGSTPAASGSSTTTVATSTTPPSTTPPSTDDSQPPAPLPADDLAESVTTSEPPMPVAPLVVTDPADPPQLRTPTGNDPLRILLIGDSYLYDAQPGIVAALEAAGTFDVAPQAQLGFALFNPDSLDILEARIAEYEPELVLAMWARFDLGFLETKDMSTDSLATYADLLDSALSILSADGAAVAVVGLAPSLSHGVDRVPIDLSINELFREAIERSSAPAFYLDPNPIVAPAGEPARWITTADGDLLVRKIDVSHFCGDGSARFGLAISQLVASLTNTAAADPASWWADNWRTDPRYDDPPAACTG